LGPETPSEEGTGPKGASVERGVSCRKGRERVLFGGKVD